MTLKLGIVMDPIEGITPYKDSSLSMLLAAQKRQWAIHYMTQHDLFIKDGTTYAKMNTLQVRDGRENWFTYGKWKTQPLESLDVILMRKDPPFNTDYIYTTYLLECAETKGVVVINKPSALRDINEKFHINWFPELCAPTMVSKTATYIREFLAQHHDIIVKPLDGMGGQSIFRIKERDQNTSVIIETITENENRFVMAQKYIPEISNGDKRILMINGEPFPYALARIPAKGELRGNLAAGGKGIGQKLTDRDLEICKTVGPTLREKGALFVGLDVIGDYLTEINITSPTCIRELDELYNTSIADDLLDKIEQLVL